LLFSHLFDALFLYTSDAGLWRVYLDSADVGKLLLSAELVVLTAVTAAVECCAADGDQPRLDGAKLPADGGSRE
jgi:hypothetical protein